MDDLQKRVAQWLQDERVSLGIPDFIKLIKIKRENLTVQAIQPGDTDYIKGQIIALKFVESLPFELVENLLKEGDDT